MIEKIKCAVLGGTGIVGQRFIQLLENHPYFELCLITASEKNENKLYSKVVNWFIEEDIPNYVKKIKISKFDFNELEKRKIKVVFSALPPKIAEIQEKRLIKKGFAVFSNSRAYRYKENVPILIPEVNPSHIKLIESQKKNGSGFIITNANCSSTGLALALKPLLKFKIKNVFVSTYQALSGAGYPGVSSLNINSNVIPFIYGEEEKIEFETKKILGELGAHRIIKNGFKILSSCARVPVRDGHLESVVVEVKDEVELLSVKKAFREFTPLSGLPTSPEKPIILQNVNDRPQPWKDAFAGKPDRAKGMSVTIGRLKKQGKYIRFWLVVHNTIRGAAGNSILNAEFAFKNGYIEMVM